MTDADVTRDDIRDAAKRIRPYIRRTPLLALGDVMGRGYDLWLKLESHQPTGSFKVRGAFSALTSIDVPAAGVVGASGGNFGLALAHAANRLEYRATIFVPEISPAEKTEKIRALGADLQVVPGFYAEALAASTRWAADSGAIAIHAYDQIEVMTGQGTCGLEIFEELPDAGSILVAVGGGGLIGGIASWYRGGAKVIGVESRLCPTLFEARRLGGPVEVAVGGVAASSLGAARLGSLPWRANRWIAQSLLVEEDEIIEARRWLWDNCRVLAEASASTTVAALLTGRYLPERGESVVVVISGANTKVEL